MTRAWWQQNWLGVVQTVGVFGAAVGLLLTYFQLAAASAQIEQAKNALRANTIFAIQKDGRELMQSIAAEPKVFRYIFDLDKSAPDQELQLKATARLGQLINYYASMYNQYEAGAVDAKFWKTGLSELCGVLETPIGSAAWRQLLSKGASGYQAGFIKEGSTCQQKT